MHLQVKEARRFIGRLPKDSDLIASITDFCVKQDIKLGVLRVIGAVKGARLGYYKQDEQAYVESVSLDKKLEIVSCTGNISLKDGKPVVHAHAAFADLEGRMYGGHLLPGAAVFAGEFYIEELTGGELRREKDGPTGLPLWKM